MMGNLSRRACVGGSLAGAVALATSQTSLLRADSPVGEEQPAKESIAPSTHVYELRIYTAPAGKLDALHKRFREHTLSFFEKHGIKNVGYWTEEVSGGGQGKLYYIVAYPDRESRDKMLVHGVAADADFLKVVKESEKDGKIVEKMDSVILNPTDYSPLQ